MRKIKRSVNNKEAVFRNVIITYDFKTQSRCNHEAEYLSKRSEFEELMMRATACRPDRPQL